MATAYHESVSERDDCTCHAPLRYRCTAPFATHATNCVPSELDARSVVSYRVEKGFVPASHAVPLYVKMRPLSVTAFSTVGPHATTVVQLISCDEYNCVHETPASVDRAMDPTSDATTIAIPALMAIETPEP